MPTHQVSSGVPCCDLCGSERRFELQLMPWLVALLELDSVGPSLDWATLLIFTCKANCAIHGDGYAREFVFKQDFVAHKEDGSEEK